MKTFNARHTVSFNGRFTENKIKETEVAKKQRLIDLTEKQFCTEHCLHKDTPCNGSCKEFEVWCAQRKQKKAIVNNPNMENFITMPTYLKQSLVDILLKLSVQELNELLQLLPETRTLTKKCLIEKELKRRKNEKN